MDEQARKDLRAKAEQATEGEWEVEESHLGDHRVMSQSENGKVVIFGGHIIKGASPANAAFIAAANPQTVIALLDEVERLRRENDIRAQALRDIRKVGHNVYPNRDALYYQDALWDIETCCAQASIDLQALEDDIGVE
jgi:hypothetical protein